MYCGAYESQGKWDFLCVHQINTIASEYAMGLVAHNKHYIGGYTIRSLVALLLKCDARARLPSALHGDREYFLAKRRRMTVVVHDTTRYFHFLYAAMIDFFEREHEIALNGRVLFLFATAGQTAKIVRFVHFGVMMKVSEWIVAAKELVEYLVRVATKCVRLTPVAILVQWHAALETLFAKLVVYGFALVFYG
jgi:hypothetical protein